MNNFLILNLQVTAALVLFLLLARQYILPVLNKQPFAKAVLPALYIEASRYLGLAIMAHGQIDEALPVNVLQQIAIGDYLTGVLALLAIAAIQYQWPGQRALVWLVSLVGLADMILAFSNFFGKGFYNYDLEGIWFLFVIVAPMLLLGQVYLFYRLLRKDPVPTA